ncbi:transposable element Tcb1 transposase [Trichonephila clavipes]|nr:transposable element Tcb1 transposase [Trichonephila clavipes]
MMRVWKQLTDEDRTTRKIASGQRQVTSYCDIAIRLIPGAIVQQDNARPYTARVSQDCLHTVTTLPWPVRSPDLSLIEHIWDHLGPRVGHFTSLNEREARLQQIRNEMYQDIIQNLYASMPDHIASCIRARGGPTGY